MFSGLSSLLAFVSALLNGLMQFTKWLDEKRRKDKQESEKKDLEKVIDEVKKPSDLDEKADAACRLERKLNPNSDCRFSDGG